MRYLTELVGFFSHVYQQRRLLAVLVADDLRRNYLGSYLGLLWAFIQPLAMIGVLWFVFEVGFRAGAAPGGVPFAVWLMSGIIPWYFFANALGGGTQAITESSFLVRKVNFRVSILPLVKIASALFIHLVFIAILAAVLLIYGYTPTLYWLQSLYYLLCLMLLLLGLSWLSASVMVFSKDVGQLVALLLLIGFWATPIFWNVSMVPEPYRFWVELNPMFYIVEGYRDSFITQVWFWEKGALSLRFLVLMLATLGVGAIVFKRLRPHFADVL
jgi:ABC-type polysaccharide/polyol phosphate export permease